MKKMVLVQAAVFAALVGASPAAAANLLVNGGFDLDNVPAGGVKVYGPGDMIGGGGWTVVGSTVNTSSTYAEDGLTIPAQAGANALDLTAGFNQGPSVGVVQSVNTIVGQLYTLSFWIGNATATTASGRAGLYAGPASISLSIGGGAMATYTNANVVEGSVDWRQFTTSFVGTDNPTSIQFNNATPTNDNYAGLDSVELSAVEVGAVPEPATWAMMIAGFGLVGASLRRRRHGAFAAG